MLKEYDTDHDMKINIQEIAEEIYQYTAGYPVLVSLICKYIDEDLSEENTFDSLGGAWTNRGIEEAVRRILIERTPLFESMIRHLDDYPEMKRMLQEILFQGKHFPLIWIPRRSALQVCLAMRLTRMEKCRSQTARRDKAL